MYSTYAHTHFYMYWRANVLDQIHKIITNFYFIKKLKWFSVVFLSVVSVDDEESKISFYTFVDAAYIKRV